MSEEKQYYAFISYNHADKKEARDLQHWLEYYKLPNVVRRDNANLPKYVRPVFRDTTHLEIGDLSKQIKEGLDQSEFLIVVCSPNAAQSGWVNKEIEYFISIGKQDKILPYIISGIPNAKNPQEECYPPAFKEITKGKEILGANINEAGKESASIRIVAKMFNLRQEVLWQRYQRDRKRKILAIILGIVTIFLFLLSFIGYAIFKNNQLRELNNQLNDSNNQIANQNEQLRTDSIKMAAQMDSITKKDTLLSFKNLELKRTNQQLQLRNNALSLAYKKIAIQKTELQLNRDSLLYAYEEIASINMLLKSASLEDKKKLAKIVASQAESLINIGDSYKARLMLLSVLPNDSQPDFPYLPEVEAALRKSFKKNNAIIYNIPSYFYTNCVFSENDSIIMIYDDTYKYVSYFDAYTGARISNSILPPKEVFSLSINSGAADFYNPIDSSYTTISTERANLYVCDKNKKKRHILHAGYKNDGVFSLAYDRNGKYILSGGTEGYIKLWDINTGKMLRKFNSNGYIIDWLAFRKDDNVFLSGSIEGLIEIWSLNDAFEKIKLNGHESQIVSANFSNRGTKLVSIGKDNTMRIWDYGRYVHDILPDEKPVSCAIFSPDERYIITGTMYDNLINKWDVKTHNWIGLRGHQSWVNHISFSSDGTKMLSSDSEEIKVWNLQNDSCIKTIDAGIFGMYAEFTSNDSSIISTWHLRTKQWPIYGDSVSIYGEYKIEHKYISPLGTKTLYHTSTFEDDYVINNITTKKVVLENSWAKDEVIDKMIFSPNEKYIIGISDYNTYSRNHEGKVFIWNADNGQLLRTIDVFNEDRYRIRCASFSPDSKYIVIGIGKSITEKKNTISVWEVNSGVQMMTYDAGFSVSSVQFSSDGQYILSASLNGETIIWDFPSFEKLTQKVKQQMQTQSLTPEERRKYYLE